MRVRLATADDREAISSVLRRAFAEYAARYTPAAFSATTPSGREVGRRLKEGPVWVAQWDHEIVGTVSAIPESQALYIRSMGVLPAARGQGVGQLLLAAVETYARDRGYERLWLTTTPFLASAIRLYERNGFQPTADRPHDLFGTPLVRMDKPLALEPTAAMLLLRRYYEELWNRWALDVAWELLTEGFQFRGSLGMEIHGIHAFQEYMQLVRTAFPDFYNTVERMVPAGGEVIVQLTYTGTHKGPFLGIPPTDRPISYPGLAIFRVESGKLAAGHVVGDRLLLMESILGKSFWRVSAG